MLGYVVSLLQLPRRIRSLHRFEQRSNMSASAFHSVFDIQPASKVTSPAPTHQKSKIPQTPRDIGVLPDIELKYFGSKKTYENIKTGGTQTPDGPLPAGAQTPKTPNELEMSRPPSPKTDDAVGQIRLWNAEPMTKWRILCCCLLYFSNGINDSGMLTS